jgi:predicted nucleic acid-binding protein
VIVLDASAAIECVLQTSKGLEITSRILSPREILHAPHLLDVEVAQTLRRFVRSRALAEDRAQEALQDFLDLRIRRYPHPPLLRRVWELRGNLTAYDALYVTLAEALPAPLLTCDSKLASSPGHRARIHLL